MALSLDWQLLGQMQARPASDSEGAAPDAAELEAEAEAEGGGGGDRIVVSSSGGTVSIVQAGAYMWRAFAGSGGVALAVCRMRS